MKSVRSSRASCDGSDVRDSEQTTDDQPCHNGAHFTYTALDDEEHQRLVTTDSARVDSPNHLSSHHHPLKLPEFEHFLRPSSTQPITELGSAPANYADQLETERADFRDVPARFQQNAAWSSASVTKSSSTLSEDKSLCQNTATRDCSLHSFRPHSQQHRKPADIRHSCISDSRQSSGDSYSDVTSARPVVSTSMSEHLSTSRLTDNSSGLLHQVILLSEQLSAQVIYTDT